MSDSLTEHFRVGAAAPPFIRRGFDGRDLPEAPRQVWERGSVQDVAWSMFINRGGGYSYRLCPKKDGQVLTEECFARGALSYASNQSWIQRGPDARNRTAIPAARTQTGTYPAGSVWTRNPVPPCASADGTPVQTPPECPQAMFTPPLPGLFGDGPGSCVAWAIHGPVEGYHTVFDSFGTAVLQGPACSKQQGLDLALQFQFNIFDQVVVPQDYEPGEYVLSFRYDAELSPQVWSHCSDVTIV